MGVIAFELPHLGCLWLRGHADDAGFTQRTRGVLGVPLPLQPRGLCGFGGGVVLWMSPDEWLLVCRRSQRDQLLRAMRGALLDVFAQVIDTSAAMTAVRLVGPHCLTLLQHLGPTVIVLRSDGDGVLLVFRRSVADHVWRLIERTAQPYGLCIAAPAQYADPLFTPLFEAA